jgi:hypothetical protein
VRLPEDNSALKHEKYKLCHDGAPNAQIPNTGKDSTGLCNPTVF